VPAGGNVTQDRRAGDRRAEQTVGVGRASVSELQLTVLELVAAGHGNKAIAERIGRNENDVKGIVSRLLLTLHAANRAELAQIAAHLDVIGENALAPQEIHELLRDSPVLTAFLRGPDHRFVFANEAYVRAAAIGDHLGRTIEEVFPLSPEIVQLCGRVYRTGVTIRSRGPVEVVDLNGRRVLDLSYVLKPVHDDDGKVTGIAFFGLDLTGAVEGEAQAR
jgi:DNA-binding CsgD family transcriptional regulator